MLLPNLASPNSAIALPNLMNDRIENDDPTVAKSRTANDDPNRVIPNTDRLLPARKNDRRDNERQFAEAGPSASQKETKVPRHSHGKNKVKLQGKQSETRPNSGQKQKTKNDRKCPEFVS